MADYNYTDVITGAIAGAGIAFFAMLMCWPSPVQATAKPAAMPAVLDLGGVLWHVDVTTYPGDSSATLSYTRCDVKHIEVKAGVSDVREDLFHEILHAYTCETAKTGFDVDNTYFNSKNDGAHRGYDRIGFVVTDALQRNPSLAAYLAGETK
jgi:hypothetical protein